jgi:hypothetical protein
LPDDPGIDGSRTPGSGDGIAVKLVGAVEGARSSASVGSFVGSDEGRTGTPGGDCAPGTPGKEYISLTEGNFDTTPGYAAFSKAAKSAPASGVASTGGANDGADSGTPGVDCERFVIGATELAEGIVPRTGWDAGMLGCDTSFS